MHEEQGVAEMAAEVLRRRRAPAPSGPGNRSKGRSRPSSGPRPVGRLGGLRDGPHREEGAREWQEDVRQERAAERRAGGRDPSG